MAAQLPANYEPQLMEPLHNFRGAGIFRSSSADEPLERVQTKSACVSPLCLSTASSNFLTKDYYSGGELTRERPFTAARSSFARAVLVRRGDGVQIALHVQQRRRLQALHNLGMPGHELF